MQRRLFLRGVSTLAACTLSPAWAQVPFLDGGQKRAFDLYRAASTGSTDALEDLRNRGNEGDRWAAMQFGFLHHTGRAPKVGRDIKIAMKAYRIASKLSGDSTAITGNPLAAYNMGLIYLYGEDGGNVDAAEAARWFKAAAGDEIRVMVHAAMNLGNLYEHGFGNLAADWAEAARWYRAAAAKNEPYALYRLGRFLVEGNGGMNANATEGRMKLQAAADRWNRPAMAYLSSLSAETRGLMEKNPVEAARWALVAADGDANYKKLADRRLKDLTEKQRGEAKDAARRWLKSHSRMPQQMDYRSPINNDPYGK